MLAKLHKSARLVSFKARKSVISILFLKKWSRPTLIHADVNHFRKRSCKLWIRLDAWDEGVSINAKPIGKTLRGEG